MVEAEFAGHGDRAENHALGEVDKENRVSCSIDLDVHNSSLDVGTDLAPAIHKEHMYCTEEGARLSSDKKKNTWTRLVHMDVGTMGILKERAKSILGKRNMLEVFSIGEIEDDKCKGKRGKVSDESNMNEAARVLNHHCRGLRSLWTVQSIHKLVREQAPNVCFLMETRLDRGRFEKHCGDLSFKNKLIVKKPNSCGRLALLRREEMTLDIINFTDNHILAKVVEDDGFVRYLTGFYRWLEANEKQKSWAFLSHLQSFIEGPWCCIGDFNVILHASEKQSVYAPYYNQMEDFRVTLEDCGLTDLGFIGNKFTWTSRRPGLAHTKQRLDRATANRVWIDKFLASSGSHLFNHASDHIPILLKTMIDRRVRGRGPGGFKFEQNWLLWANCEEAVIETWTKGGCDNSGLSGVQDQIQACGVELLA